MAEKNVKLEVSETGEKILETNDPNKVGEAIKESLENSPENKPSKEEVEEAKKEYEEAAKNFSVKTWVLGVVEERDEIYNYLKYFIENRLFWTKNGWMGVVKLTEELDAAYELANASKDSIKLGYQAMEFLFYSLSNPGGIGLEAAKNFESDFDTFAKIFAYVEDEVKASRKLLEDIQFMQNKWAAMAQGFYLEVEPVEPDEELQEKGEEERGQGEEVTE